MNSLPVIPLSTWAKGKSDDEVLDFLKGFSCKKNKEVQWFLRKLSMKFARRNIAATHLVLSEDLDRIVAYYYTRNGFVSMNSHSDSGENDKLAQLFRFID